MGRVGKTILGVAIGLVIIGVVVGTWWSEKQSAPRPAAAHITTQPPPPPPLVIQGEQSYYEEIPNLANSEDPHAISAALDAFVKDNPGAHIVSMTIGKKGIYIFWMCTRCR